MASAPYGSPVQLGDGHLRGHRQVLAWESQYRAFTTIERREDKPVLIAKLLITLPVVPLLF